MKIIDCSSSIGYDVVNSMIINHENYPVYEKVKQAANADELIAELDFCGIDEAIVYHRSMFDVSPTYGNKMILKEIEKFPGRLKGTWTILPPLTEAEFLPEKLFPAMKENNIIGLRAFPEWNRFFLDRVTCGELIDVIVEKNVPLYLSPMHGWEHIFNVLKEFPKLTVIITNYGLWGSDRYFYPLVREYGNVYIDTSDYQVLGGYEAFINKFGSDRLVFGSDFPMDNIGGTITTLFGSWINESDKENIAFRNIERLLEKVRL